MLLSVLFKSLGAPLTNMRGSWGAVRPADNSVFLRVWQDEVKRVGGHMLVRVTAQGAPEGDQPVGYGERLKHVQLIRDGAKSYMIMCEAVETGASPRSLKRFNEREVFVGGALQELDGDFWLQATERLPVASVRT